MRKGYISDIFAMKIVVLGCYDTKRYRYIYHLPDKTIRRKDISDLGCFLVDDVSAWERVNISISNKLISFKDNKEMDLIIIKGVGGTKVLIRRYFPLEWLCKYAVDFWLGDNLVKCEIYNNKRLAVIAAINYINKERRDNSYTN